MKKTLTKLLAVAMTASVLLSACSSGTTTTENEGGESTNTGSEGTTTEESGSETETETASTGEEIKDLVIPRLSTRELQTFNILYSQMAPDFENLCNLTDPLLEVTPSGELAPCMAEEWGSEDGGLTWTFHLREGVKWVDMNGNEMADVTARDFATGLEWVLNFYKNDSANTSMPIEMIEGASEYYEYTKTLTQEEAYALTADDGSQFLEMVGIEIPDDYTIVYHCIDPKPYFDTVATYACMYPISQGLIDSLGVDGVKAMNNENMWYNGCYTMTSYIQGNEKVFTKNESYWDTDAKSFDTVTVRMVESNDVAFQLYQSGELDYVDLTESNLKTISGNENNEFYNYLVEKPADKYSYQIHFNFDKYTEDGTKDTNWNTAIANEAFRLSWYYGLDLSEYYKRFNTIDPMSCENECFTMKGLVYTSDGTDYTELVKQELGLPEMDGETIVRLDADKAEQYKQQAIEELTALGVTFPVSVDYYIAASNQTSLDSATVFGQALSDSLGDDYVKLNIKTYVSSERTEVFDPKLHSITIRGWGADYGDPQNYLGQQMYGYDNAFYSTGYNYIVDVEETDATRDLLNCYKEFTSMVEEANAISDDLDARYAAYAKAEAYLIQHGLVIPAYYNVPYCLTRINVYSKMNSMYGSQNEKMKNWETNADGYTTEEIENYVAQQNA